MVDSLGETGRERKGDRTDTQCMMEMTVGSVKKSVAYAVLRFA